MRKRLEPPSSTIQENNTTPVTLYYWVDSKNPIQINNLTRCERITIETISSEQPKVQQQKNSSEHT